MKFKVYDNGKPAKYPECKVNKKWSNNSFDTFQEALQYAHHWLGDFSPCDVSDSPIQLNEPYDYDGCGDTIEIKYEE